jgi:hypothetical protein
MALPPSGPLSIGAIRTEFGTSNGSLRYLSSLAGFTTPDSISEFYNYGAVDAYLMTQSGLYPVTGPNTTVTGYIWNNTLSIIYVKLQFNSGGQSGGSIAPNVDVLAVYLDSIVSISVSGTITGFGTNLISSSLIAIPANSSKYFYIDKFDGFGSGSTLRVYYSTSIGGTYIPIPQQFP